MSTTETILSGAVQPLTQLSEDEQMLRDAAAEFAQQEITPRILEMDEKAALDPDLVKSFFEMGLMGIEIPEELGGAGGSFFMSIVAIEQISKVDASVGVFMDVQNTLVNNAFLRYGSDDLQQRYLPRLASESVGAYCLSEAASGSDAFALKSSAVKEGNGYRLNGAKLWISNANEADIFIVFANAKPEDGYKGITAFVVERDMEGFSVSKKEDKLGIRARGQRLLLGQAAEPVPHAKCDWRTSLFQREIFLGSLAKGIRWPLRRSMRVV